MALFPPLWVHQPPVSSSHMTGHVSKGDTLNYEKPMVVDYGDLEAVTAAAAPVSVADVTIPAGDPLTSPS